MIWWSLPKSSGFQYFLKACFSWLFIFPCCREGNLRTSDSFWFCFFVLIIFYSFCCYLSFFTFMFCTLVLFWFFLFQGLIWFWLLLPYCKKKKKNSITFQIYMYSNKSRNQIFAVFLKNHANWLGYGSETITFCLVSSLVFIWEFSTWIANFVGFSFRHLVIDLKSDSANFVDSLWILYISV